MVSEVKRRCPRPPFQVSAYENGFVPLPFALFSYTTNAEAWMHCKTSASASFHAFSFCYLCTGNFTVSLLFLFSSVACSLSPRARIMRQCSLLRLQKPATGSLLCDRCERAIIAVSLIAFAHPATSQCTAVYWAGDEEDDVQRTFETCEAKTKIMNGGCSAAARIDESFCLWRRRVSNGFCRAAMCAAR